MMSMAMVITIATRRRVSSVRQPKPQSSPAGKVVADSVLIASVVTFMESLSLLSLPMPWFRPLIKFSWPSPVVLHPGYLSLSLSRRHIVCNFKGLFDPFCYIFAMNWNDFINKYDISCFLPLWQTSILVMC